MSDHTSPFDRRSFLRGLGAIGATGAFTGLASARSEPSFSGETTELIVGTSGSTAPSALSSTVQAALPANATLVKENAQLGYTKVEVDTESGVGVQSASALEAELTDQPGIDYVEPNVTYEKLDVTPNDPKFDEQYAPQQCNAPAAWEVTEGSNDVTVAIVDSGTDYRHENFEGRVVDDDPGQDFIWGFRDDPAPLIGAMDFHGTHVAGIATATTNNETGIAGLSNSRLLAARALNTLGMGSMDDIADAIQWAADEGADIINLSLGGGGEMETMRNAVEYAVENGALPIAAAGNDGENGSDGVSYPAAYEAVVAVSAVDSDEELASFSDYGEKVDVAAPGVDVLSTMPDGEYDTASGTSMASPAASGVAALGLAAADGDLSPEELRELLTETARDIGLDELEQGAGHVDAAALVDAVQ